MRSCRYRAGTARRCVGHLRAIERYAHVRGAGAALRGARGTLGAVGGARGLQFLISPGALKRERGERASVIAFPSQTLQEWNSDARGSAPGSPADSSANLQPNLRAAPSRAPIAAAGSAGRRSAPRFRRCVGAQPSAGRDVNNRFGRVERALTAGGGQNGRRPDGSEGASCGSGVAGYQR